MEFQNLIPLNWHNQRILTYKQVAEGLKCSRDLLRMHFKNHEELFQEGVHYFKLEGEVLRTFKKNVNQVYIDSPHSFPSFIKGAKCLVLWTCQGVARLSKLIDTPEAWQLFTELENNYFNNEEVALPAPEAVLVDESERLMIRMKKQFAVTEKYDLAVVYALLLSNLTVKIGVTDNLTRRIKELKAETKLDVFQFKTTAYMSREEALALEAALKEKYAADCLGGEYFDVRFVDLCKDL